MTLLPNKRFSRVMDTETPKTGRGEPTMMPGRTTMYRGTEMRSRNEARFAAALDEAEFAWEYEPMCYADGRVQYLPDFKVATSKGDVFIETKGTKPRLAAVLRRMHAVRASVEDAYLAVTCPTWRGYMVLDTPGGITVIAHWARWSKGGVSESGPFTIGSVIDAGGCLEDGVNALLGRHLLGDGDYLEFLPFDWHYDGDGERRA